MRITAAVEIDLRDTDRPATAIGRATAIIPPGTVVKVIVGEHTQPGEVLPHLPETATVQLVATDGATLTRWHTAIRGDAS